MYPEIYRDINKVIKSVTSSVDKTPTFVPITSIVSRMKDGDRILDVQDKSIIPRDMAEQMVREGADGGVLDDQKV